MRILYFAKDSPAVNSGYGKCVREILTRLQKHHKVASFSTVGNKATHIHKVHGITTYPGTDNLMGEDIVEKHFAHFNADILITQMDIWPFNRLPNQVASMIPWIPYIPIDFDPIPDWIIEKIKPAFDIITMSNWAQRKLSKKGLQSTTIHHGVDTNTFRPLPEKNALKRQLGFSEDVFLITMVQANQLWRKAWSEQLQAVKRFAEDKKDVALYIHCLPNIGDGYNLDNLIRELELEKITRLAEDYHFLLGFSEEEMATIYNAADVLLYATNSEGFGLPVIESECCGTPAITIDATATTETNLQQLLVPPIDWFYAPNPPLHKAIPDRDIIVHHLEVLYKKRHSDSKEQMRTSMAEEAKKLWDWNEVIIPQWLIYLKKIQAKLKLSCFKIPQSSKAFNKVASKIISF